MRLSQKLEEAIFVLSDEELLNVLSESVIHDMRVGEFSPESLEEAFVGILSSYGLTEEDADIVDEAIDEFGESMGLSEGFLDKLKKAAKDALKAAGKAALDAAKEGGKEVVSAGARELQKKLKGQPKSKKDEPEKKEKKDDKKKEKDDEKKEPDKSDDDDEPDDIKKKLKGIAGKALGDIADDPSKAKEALKKHGKKAVKALAKHGVKKGMKMVFGRWVKSGKSKKEAIEWLLSRSESHCLGEGAKVYDYEGEVPQWVIEAFGAETCGQMDSRKYELVLKQEERAERCGSVAVSDPKKKKKKKKKRKKPAAIPIDAVGKVGKKKTQTEANHVQFSMIEAGD